MSISLDGQILPGGTYLSEWKWCFMWRERHSISGNLISGIGLTRRICGIDEDTDKLGYEYYDTNQFAKNKKEIFKHKLKGYK